jgi:hypothetical protein
VAVALALVAGGAARAANPAFPGTDPNESVRIHTPDDPRFDQCEPHPVGEGAQTCTGVFNQEFARFGFAPSATQDTATYKNPTDPHVARLMAQNTAAGRTALGQVSGVSADRAWKFSTGDPSVQVGIVDTGIEWDNRGLRTKAWLNAGELPTPQHDRATAVSDAIPAKPCPAYATADDANGDGAFDVRDFVCDSRVSVSWSGRKGPNGLLTAQDLIHAFGVGGDDDGNGYVDDISGWDFFDDDNDPYDASSYSAADGHGSGRSAEAATATNDGDGGTAVCPRCQFVPLRAWDSFVLDTNNFGQAVTYAADNGIEVVEGAVGGLYNSRFDREAFDYAYRHGVFFTIVSSDANTAAHNFPTVYNEALMVAGVVADQHGLSNSQLDYPATLISFFGQFGIQILPPANAPVATWFRNSGLTQYGGHAGIVMPATSGSEATGQASGAAGLLMSYGRRRSAVDPLFGPPLAPNEVKQLLTMTAEDVVPENTAGVGTPDPAQVGWDQHFGYGRPDLGLAMEWIRDRKVPPQALITGPDWFAPLDVDRDHTVEVRGRISAPRAAGYDWKLQWAPGIEPCEAEFQDVAPSHHETAPVDGALGTVDLVAVRDALDARHAAAPDPACRRTPGPVQGGSTVDPTAPRPGPGDRDPNEPAFTVRVVVTAGANRGEHRKVLFAYRDPTLHAGWSKRVGAGGEASQRLFDLNGDNALDVIQADSAGELRVLGADGTPLPSFNHGDPVTTREYANVHSGAPAYSAIEAPREVLRTPAVGDIDGDLEPEVVATAGEHVYAWNADGTPVPGFPVRLDPAFSAPAVRTKENHVKRGFHAAATLADLDGAGPLEIVAPAMDQHLYAWDGHGDPVPGFPVLLRAPGDTPQQTPGSESVTTASAGDLDGDGRTDIVAPTNELTPSSGAGVPGFTPGEGRIYAVNGHGALLPGWPARPSGELPGLIPFFGPGLETALGNLTGDAKPEVVGGITSSEVSAYGQNAAKQVGYLPEPAASSETVSRSYIANTFEYPTVADLDGNGGLEVLKGGISIEGVANLLLVGQNAPYNHVMQAWDGASGNPLPGWPQAVEDYQWMSNPAVADVSDAPGVEVLAPTGLYTVRNLNAQGIEGAGWPKFTGGWNLATPAVGDADGDGKLEVAQITREGFSFLWDSPQPACGTNDQWWTSRHDEWNTGAHGTDTRPPGSPRSLAAARSGGTVSLTWTAPGDDWLCGGARRFRVLTSASPILHPGDGTSRGDFVTTKQAGEGDTLTLPSVAPGDHVAILYQDDAGNWGHLTDVATGAPGAGNAAPTCADLGPLPVQRDAAKRLDLVCADPDGDPLTLSVSAGPAHGSLGPIDPATHSVTYTPDSGYSGPDDFTYRANDGQADSPAAKVSLVVAAAANHPPVCDDVGVLGVEHDQPRTVPLRCTDPDGDSLVLSPVSRPSRGTLGDVDQAHDTVVYTPRAGEQGTDEFTYRANDARADSAPATVRLAIAPAAAAAGTRPPRGTVPAACASTAGFRSLTVRPAGAGLRLAFTAVSGRPSARVDLFEQTVGRFVGGRRRIGLGSRAGAFTWPGRAPGLHDGWWSARLQVRAGNRQLDTRRVGLRRVGGRWRLTPPYYRTSACGLVRYLSLNRPVFGGSRGRALWIGFRLGAAARVRVDVLRGRRLVRRFAARTLAAGATGRRRVSAAGLPAGLYTVRLTVVGAGRTIVTRGFARRI